MPDIATILNQDDEALTDISEGLLKEGTSLDTLERYEAAVGYSREGGILRPLTREERVGFPKRVFAEYLAQKPALREEIRRHVRRSTS